MHIGDFGTPTPTGKGHTIKFHNVTLTLVARANGLALMQYAKLIAHEENGGAFTMAEAAIVDDVLRTFFPPAEWQKFVKLASLKGVDLNELIRLLHRIVETYTSVNPTEPSSESSPGRSRNGRASKSTYTPVSESTPTRRRTG